MKNFYITLLFLVGFDVKLAFGAEKGMPQLNPEFWLSQIFWLTLIFVILYITIWKIFLPRIAVSIENRKSRVVNDLNEAQKLKENVETKIKEYNKIIEESKNEARKIIEENKKALDKDIENKKKKFYEEIEKELLVVEKEIKNLKKTSISSINKIAGEIAGEMLKLIVGTTVNSSNLNAIVEDLSKKKLEKVQ